MVNEYNGVTPIATAADMTKVPGIEPKKSYNTKSAFGGFFGFLNRGVEQ